MSGWAAPVAPKIRRRFWRVVDRALATVRLERISQRPVYTMTANGYLKVTFPNGFRWSGRQDYHDFRRISVVPNPALEPEPCD